MAAEYEYKITFRGPCEKEDWPQVKTEVLIEITKEGVSLGEAAEQEYANSEYWMVVSSTAHSQQRLAVFLLDNTNSIREKCRKVDPDWRSPPPPLTVDSYSNQSTQDTKQTDLPEDTGATDPTQGSARSVV